MHPGANPTNIFLNKLKHSICKLETISVHSGKLWMILNW
jgi:hypothetical protein